MGVTHWAFHWCPDVPPPQTRGRSPEGAEHYYLPEEGFGKVFDLEYGARARARVRKEVAPKFYS